MITLKDVTMLSKSGNKKLLDSVCLEIVQGDYVLIKSASMTALKSLALLLSGKSLPVSGDVYVDGIVTRDYAPQDYAKLRREKISYLYLWQELDNNLSIKENVLLPLMYAGKEYNKREELAERALTIVGMQKFFDAKVEDLNFWQMNKVLLARAIVTSPRMLIMEEPSRLGDPDKIEEVSALFTALNTEGITIVILSSRDGYEKSAKKIFELDGGALTEKVILRTSKPTSEIAKQKRTKKTAEKKTVNNEQENEKIEPVEVKDHIEEVAGLNKQLSFDELAKSDDTEKAPKKRPTTKKKGGDKINEV